MSKYKNLFAVVVLGALMGISTPATAETARTTIWFSSSEDVLRGAYMVHEGKTMQGMQILHEALGNELTFYDRASAHTNLCAAYLDLKLYDTALDHCSRAISLKPMMWQALNNLAVAHHSLGNYDEAIGYYRKALKHSPDDEVLASNLAISQKSKRLNFAPLVKKQEG